MIALLIINDLNILSIKLGYSEIPLSIFEFFQFLMDILKIWQTGFLYCWLIIINTIVDFSIFLTWELNYNAGRKCIENDIDNYCKRSRNNEIYKKWLAPGLDQRFLSKLTPSSHNLAYCSICWLRKCIVIIPWNDDA